MNNLTDVEKRLLKLIGDEENQQENLTMIRLCMSYLSDKYGKEFEIVNFEPYDTFNSRSKLNFRAGGEEIYTVYVDDSIGELQDDYFRVNIGNRYDQWLTGKIEEENSGLKIEKVATRFSGLFGFDFTGNATVEELVAMKNDLKRDTDIVIAAGESADAVKELIEKVNSKYEIKGFYRIISGDEELTYFKSYDI